LVNDKPVAAIPYGVEIPPADLLAGRNFSGIPLRIIYVGRLVHSQKGILFLPEILAACRRKGINVALTIIGDGPNRQALLDKAASLNVSDLMVWKGALPLKETYAEMASAHMLLLPSFFEGLPIVLLEAMASGCVPLASRLSGITDFAVEHSKNGLLIEVGDIDGFADAIDHVFHDRLELQSMSLTARSTIQERFTVERMARAYLELIRRIQGGEFGTLSRSNLPRIDPEMISPAAHGPAKFDSIYGYGRAALRRFLLFSGALRKRIIAQ
jgi:glycosyltransferase involved in cell wall biosynthesis